MFESDGEGPATPSKIYPDGTSLKELTVSFKGDGKKERVAFCLHYHVDALGNVIKMHLKRGADWNSTGSYEFYADISVETENAVKALVGSNYRLQNGTVLSAIYSS